MNTGPVHGIRCVGAVVHDAQGRLLLIRRGTEPGRGLWSLPGGRVEPGETDAEALVREVREETGLLISVGRLVGTVTRPAPAGTYEIHDYAGTVTGGALAAGTDADDARWADLATFLTLERSNLLTAALAPTLREWNALPAA